MENQNEAYKRIIESYKTNYRKTQQTINVWKETKEAIQDMIHGRHILPLVDP